MDKKDKKEVVEKFKARYQTDDVRAVRSPLRICPIGAHSDFQGGCVSAMALDSSVYLFYTPNRDGLVELESLDFPDKEYFWVSDNFTYIPGFWGNYVRGAVAALKQDHIIRTGISGYVVGSLPIGGLSSSAAVTTAYLMALCDVNQIDFEPMDIVHWSHWVENEFIGLQNGILDQAANVLSRKDCLMVMDCRTEEYELISQGDDFPDFEIVVVYSGISKNLMGTDFNNRVDECRVASWDMMAYAGRETLPPFREAQFRDVPVEDYRKYRDRLPERFARRADHWYSEQDRVRQGAEAWRRSDIDSFGQLMFESGLSSFYKYESGIPEMKKIYDILKESPGVYGARPSGAGYRGAVIGLVNPAYKESIKEKIDQEYPAAYPEYQDSYEVNFCRTADGASYESLEEVN